MPSGTGDRSWKSESLIRENQRGSEGREPDEELELGGEAPSEWVSESWTWLGSLLLLTT